MHYHIYRNETVSPPRPEAELRASLLAGRLGPDTPCIPQGGTEWSSLGALFPDIVPGSAPEPTPVRSVPQVARPEPAVVAAALVPNTVPASEVQAAAPTGALRSPGRRWLVESGKLAVVTVCGLITSLILGAILALVELYTGWALYSFTLWFVLPVGAHLTGIAAAAGFYYIARWIHYYPRFLFFISSVAIAASTLITIHFIVWAGSEHEGQPLSELIAFPDYLSAVVHHSTITFTKHPDSPIELGETASLLYFAIQLLGFVASGILPFTRLRNQPYCHLSGRYKRVAKVAELYESNPDVLDSQVGVIRSLLEQGQFHQAIARHPMRQSLEKRGFTQGARSVITLYKSKNSPTTTVRHQIFISTGQKNAWNELGDFTTDYETDVL